MSRIEFQKPLFFAAVLLAALGSSAALPAADSLFKVPQRIQEKQPVEDANKDSSFDEVGLAMVSWNCGSTQSGSYSCDVTIPVTAVSSHVGVLAQMADKWEDLVIYGSNGSNQPQVRVESYDDPLGERALAVCLAVALKAQGSDEFMKIKVGWKEKPDTTSYQNPAERKLHARFAAPLNLPDRPSGVTCSLGQH